MVAWGAATVTAAIVVLAAAVVLLAVLVIGLLRSQAQVVDVLEELTGGASPEDRDGERPSEPEASRSDRRRTRRAGRERASRTGWDAPDIVGESPRGDRLRLGVSEAPRVLLVFLTSSCRSCENLWDALSAGRGHDLPGRPIVAVVTPSPATEDRQRVTELAGKGAAVIMSSDGWQDYGVTGSSFVVVVEGGKVRGEGPVDSWQELAGLAGSPE